MMKIAVANMKGGVGKSTSAMMLADVLSHGHSKQVLLVDCDPQANLSQMILSFSGLRNAKTAGRTITSWVDGFGAGALAANPPQALISGSDTICHDVSGLESLRIGNNSRRNGQLALWDSTPDLRFSELAFDHLNYKTSDNERPRQLLSGLLRDALDVANHYDYVIFDCPPGFTTLAQSVFLNADMILSPLNVDRVSLWSLMSFWQQGLDETLLLSDTPRFAFLTMVQNGRGAEQERLQVRGDLRSFAGANVLRTEIPYSVQALRFVRRPTLNSFDTFNHKYGRIRKKVHEFGDEVLRLAKTIVGEENASE